MCPPPGCLQDELGQLYQYSEKLEKILTKVGLCRKAQSAPLGTWCSKRQLSPDDSLTLYRRVLEAPDSTVLPAVCCMRLRAAVENTCMGCCCCAISLAGRCQCCLACAARGRRVPSFVTRCAAALKAAVHVLQVQRGQYSISAQAGLRMLRIPAAELPLASERDRVKLLKQRILDTDKFDKTFLVRPAAASSTLQMETLQSPVTWTTCPSPASAALPGFWHQMSTSLTMVAAALGCRQCCLSVLQLQSVLLSLLQLRTPRPAAESAEWGPSGRAVTAPAGVVGRPPLPTQVAQLQAEVARLQSQLVMVSSLQAQCVLWAHNLIGS